MPERPNFLIVMTDQQQAAVVDPAHPCRTPHASRLAEHGLRFTRAYTPTAHCSPARATFMTGLYPSRHGVYNNVFNAAAIHTALNPGVVTLGEALRGVGYRLSFAGKWHVSAAQRPADHGWDELFVSAVAPTHHGRSIDQWRAEPQTAGQEPRQRGTIARPGWGAFRLYGSVDDETVAGAGALEHDERVTSAAVAALPQLARGDRPWALYAGLIGPHDPFVVPRRYRNLYDPSSVTLPVSYSDALDDKPRVYQRMRRQLWDQLGQDEVRESIAHYWAYCTYVDEQLGRILAALDASGQADNTLVLFVSDHGEYCGAHGLYLKGVPAFSEAYHVPCIARWPAGIARPGRLVDSFVTLADWAPTLIELAGASLPDRLTGRSVVPLLGDSVPGDWPDAVHTQMNGVELYYSQRAVITEQHKYVYNGFDYDELYDLRDDPHELHNRAEDRAYQTVKRELVRRMWQFAARENDSIFNPYGTVALAPWGPADALGA